jgi:hypothetical protein
VTAQPLEIRMAHLERVFVSRFAQVDSRFVQVDSRFAQSRCPAPEIGAEGRRIPMADDVAYRRDLGYDDLGHLAASRLTNPG